MALNLGVTSCQSLEISLDQFVRGEVLEGSNAYYCEKCKEKVSPSLGPAPAGVAAPPQVLMGAVDLSLRHQSSIYRHQYRIVIPDVWHRTILANFDI